MKKIYLAYLLLIILSACGSKNTNSVYLNGEIKGLGNDTLYIYGTDKFYNRMDTLSCQGWQVLCNPSPPDDACLYMAAIQWRHRISALPEQRRQNKDKSSAAELTSLEITGNAPNEELTAFQKELKGLSTPSEKALEEKAEAFINSHPSSLVSIYLLEKYFVQKPQPDFSLIKEMTEHMTGGLKDRPYVDELLDLIQEEEKVSVGKTIPYVNLPKCQRHTKSARTSFKDKYLLIHFLGILGPAKHGSQRCPAPDLQERRKETSYSHSGAFPWISTERNGKKQSKEIPWSGNRVVISPDGTQRPSNSSPYKHCLPICSLALPENWREEYEWGRHQKETGGDRAKGKREEREWKETQKQNRR